MAPSQQKTPSSSRGAYNPLDAVVFNTPPLSSLARQQLLQKAHAAGQLTLGNARALDDHLVYAMHTDPASQRRMKMVLGKDVVDTSVACMVGHTQFHASLEEIAAFFRHETLGADVLETRQLHALVEPSPDDPLRYAGVHWTAYKMPIAVNRDFCYVESHHEFVDQSTGSAPRRGWLRMLHSIDVPGCPPLPSSLGLVRTRLFRSGHVFLEGASGLVDCYAVLAVQFHADSAAQNLQMSFMRKWVTQVMALPNQFLFRRLTNTPLLPEDAMRAKDKVKMCMVCTSRFGLFNVKHNCRVCGQVVCGSCHIQWKLHDSKVRVCLKCSDGAGGAARPSSRDSIQSQQSQGTTWTTTQSSRRHLSSRGGGGNNNVKGDMHNTTRSSISSESPSMDATCRSECSDDVVLFDPIEFEKSTRDSFSEAVVDVSSLERNKPRRASPVSLHELLQQMYDDKSAVVQGLYADLVAQK
ncbi:Aste57867_14786 [Aphanomyces stellatus]|uniref:Aste57867_14786 protein n=1 Tax=Aphanomyces stellatus TaxID=120398 RepID=A0A485L2J3_9STRA|nr:hypothetical protein As57867_014731 [Aphanomyces stellatus]VFT91604.1 Aste57867_14786 [Aphanomyces stellatus]